MSKDVFLFFFLVGAALLAVWVAVRFPRYPATLTGALAHVAVTFGVSFALAPVLAVVAGDGRQLLAVFAVALPALTYMFLVGFWLLRAARSALPH